MRERETGLFERNARKRVSERAWLYILLIKSTIYGFAIYNFNVTDRFQKDWETIYVWCRVTHWDVSCCVRRSLTAPFFSLRPNKKNTKRRKRRKIEKREKDRRNGMKKRKKKCEEKGGKKGEEAREENDAFALMNQNFRFIGTRERSSTGILSGGTVGSTLAGTSFPYFS